MKIALLDRQNDRWQSPGGGWPPYWRYPNSNKRNGKSGGWYRSRFIWAGCRRRPRYCRNVRQVAAQHYRRLQLNGGGLAHSKNTPDSSGFLFSLPFLLCLYFLRSSPDAGTTPAFECRIVASPKRLPVAEFLMRLEVAVFPPASADWDRPMSLSVR